MYKFKFKSFIDIYAPIEMKQFQSETTVNDIHRSSVKPNEDVGKLRVVRGKQFCSSAD